MLRLPLLAAFLGLIAFGCVLRSWKLTGAGLWYDELWTVVGASDRPFLELYREWILGDPHPPGFFLFNFLWFKVFPNDELWSRLPSALAGIGSVALLLFGPRKTLTFDERVFGASFVAFSHAYVFYALTVKQYSAMLFLATVAMLAWLEMVEARRVDRGPALRFGLALVGLAWLNYLATAWAAMLFGLLLLSVRGDRAALRRALGCGGVVALVCSPLLYFQYLMLRYTPGDWQHDSFRTLLEDWLPNLFFLDGAVPVVAGAFVAAALLALAVRPEARLALRSPRNRHLLLVLGLTLASLLLGGLFKPLYFIRYFLLAFPSLLLAMAILTAAAFPLRNAGLALVPLAFFLHAARVEFRAVDGLERQQWDKSVDLVLASVRPDDVVYVLGASQDKTMLEYLNEGNEFGVYYVRNLSFYRYYFRRRGAAAWAERLEVVAPTVESAAELISRHRHSGRTAWILAGHHIKYSEEAVEALRREARRLEVKELFSTRVYEAAF